MGAECEGVDGEAGGEPAGGLHVGGGAGGDHAVSPHEVHAGPLALGLVRVGEHNSGSEHFN